MTRVVMKELLISAVASFVLLIIQFIGFAIVFGSGLSGGGSSQVLEILSYPFMAIYSFAGKLVGIFGPNFGIYSERLFLPNMLIVFCIYWLCIFFLTQGIQIVRNRRVDQE